MGALGYRWRMNYSALAPPDLLHVCRSEARRRGRGGRWRCKANLEPVFWFIFISPRADTLSGSGQSFSTKQHCFCILTRTSYPSHTGEYFFPFLPLRTDGLRLCRSGGATRCREERSVHTGRGKIGNCPTAAEP